MDDYRGYVITDQVTTTTVETHKRLAKETRDGKPTGRSAVMTMVVASTDSPETRQLKIQMLDAGMRSHIDAQIAKQAPVEG